MKKTNPENWPELSLKTRSLLIILSGLPGAGKDTVIGRMKESGPMLEYIVTVTTRTRRESEQNEVDYHFTTTEKFQRMIKNNQLLEWANVYGNFYGVPKEPVKEALKAGKDTFLKVDIQGAKTLKKIFPEAIFIFLIPPSKEELLNRLKTRQTESPSDLKLRLKTAEEEIKKLSLFDYVVVNWQDKIDLSVSVINAIVTAEKHRIKPREIDL